MKMMGTVNGGVGKPQTLVKAAKFGEPFIVVIANRLGLLFSFCRQHYQHAGKVGRALKKVSDVLHGKTVHLAATQFVSGAIGGGSATYATHWLDTIKVKMQANPQDYRSAFDCLRVTLKSDGIRGLYKGATIAVAGNMTKASIVFLSYGFCEEMVCSMMGKKTEQDMSLTQHALAGAMTGVMSTLILCPMELVKCRMQALNEISTNSNRYAGPIGLTKHILRKEGFRGLYRGLSGMWTKEIPGSFIFFGSYEMARGFCRNAVQEEYQTSTPAVFLCGVFAGLCFCSTHPIESVKTRVQVAKPGECRGFVHALTQILKHEGVKPLFSGLRPSMVRACLFSGIQFRIYEAVRERLGRKPP